MIFKEIKGDLFLNTHPNDSLAHCISKDLKRSKGIATEFVKLFGRKDNELLSQNPTIGDIVIIDFIENPTKFIYNLITKEKYFHKPNGYKSITECLTKMRDHAIKNNVTNINMPRIGCGLDKLKWNNVQEIIIDIFSNTNIKITVYYLE
jgi:O-acetyl-ADP-ribose deacetylase (regulator of RNase III)